MQIIEKNHILPKNLETISNSLFSECISLEEIDIPDSVVEIKDYAFEKAISLKSIRLSKSVITISPQAFINCESLSSFIVHEQNPKLITIDGFLVLLPNVLVAYPNGRKDKDVIVPNQITIFNTYSFSFNPHVEILRLNKAEFLDTNSIYQCINLKQIYISSSTVDIEEDPIENCKNLKQIHVDKGNKIIHDADGMLIKSNEVILCPSNHPNKSIIIPYGIERIGNKAFHYCHNIEDIVFPSSLITIGKYAFNECTALKSIILPNSVKEIGACAFLDCISMESIDLGQIVKIDNFILRGTSIKSIHIPKSIENIVNLYFSRMDMLESFSVDQENEKYHAPGGILYSKLKPDIINYPINHPGKKLNIEGDFNSLELQRAKNLEEISSSTSMYISYGGVIYENSNTRTLLVIPYSIQKETIEFLSDCAIDTGYSFQGMRNTKRFIVSSSNRNIYTVNGILYSSSNDLLKVPPKYEKDTVKIGPETYLPSESTVFDGCNSIKKIEVDPSNRYYKSFDGILFDKTLSVLIYYPINKDSSEITIPYSTIEIDFSITNNEYLSSILVESGNDLFSSKDGILYDRFYQKIIRCPPKIQKNSIVLPSSVVELSSNAFQNCINVKSIYINSDHLTKMGTNVFLGSKALECISYSGLTGPINNEFPQTTESATIYVSESYSSSKFGMLPVTKSSRNLSEICKIDIPNQKKPNNTWLFIGGITCGVAIIIISVWFYIKSHNKGGWKASDYEQVGI